MTCPDSVSHILRMMYVLYSTIQHSTINRECWPNHALSTLAIMMSLPLFGLLSANHSSTAQIRTFGAYLDLLQPSTSEQRWRPHQMAMENIITNIQRLPSNGMKDRTK